METKDDKRKNLILIIIGISISFIVLIFIIIYLYNLESKNADLQAKVNSLINASTNVSSNTIISEIPKQVSSANNVSKANNNSTPASKITKPTNDLETALSQYNDLATNIKQLKFTIKIEENTQNTYPYDLWVKTIFNSNEIHDIVLSINYTDEQKKEFYNNLKQHQQNIYNKVSELRPNKKIYGCYYDSWYKYPNTKVHLEECYMCSWTNFDIDIMFPFQDYNQTKISTFSFPKNNQDMDDIWFK